MFYQDEVGFHHTTVLAMNLTRVDEIMQDFYGPTVVVCQVIEVDQ